MSSSHTRSETPGPPPLVGSNRDSDGRLYHHFTVDVEEYFQVAAMASTVPRARWPELESRVERTTEAILELLDRHDVRGTFFTLGWVADRYPDLVRAIAGAGHEIASHGWGHRKVTDVTIEQFRDSVRRSKALLEDLTGGEVAGFRAPSFSIVRGQEWALDVLIEEGYRYDSSLFPIWRPGYGYRGGGRDPHTVSRPRGSLREYPPTTLSFGAVRLPAAGGAYLRLLPYGLVARGLRQAEQRQAPGTVYIHPWDLDPEQPRLAVPPLTRVRHYAGLGKTAARLDRLLSEFRFCTIAESEAEVSPETS